jgi:hypothetical protein
MGGVMGGCGLLQFYQEPNTMGVEVHKASDENLSDYFESQRRASMQASATALEQHQGRMVPLAVANVLLSALLIVACARALAGKRNAHGLALQAVAANILYAIADFFVSAPVREAAIAAMASRPMPGDSQGLDAAQFSAAITWSIRLFSTGHVLLLGLVAYALTRPQVIAFFRPMEEESPSEEV